MGEGGDNLVDSVGPLQRIGARGAQDRAAAGQDAGYVGKIEGHGLILEKAAPAFEKSYEFIFVVKAAFAHYGTDDGVQPWTIASAGQDADSHCLLLITLGCSARVTWTEAPETLQAPAGCDGIIRLTRRFGCWRPRDFWRSGPVSKLPTIRELVQRGS